MQLQNLYFLQSKQRKYQQIGFLRDFKLAELLNTGLITTSTIFKTRGAPTGAGTVAFAILLLLH